MHHSAWREDLGTPVSQVRVPRLREGEALAQGHIAAKWQRQDLNPGRLVPAPCS